MKSNTFNSVIPMIFAHTIFPLCLNALAVNSLAASAYSEEQGNLNSWLFYITICAEPIDGNYQINIDLINEAVGRGADINETFPTSYDDDPKNRDTLLARAVEKKRDIAIIRSLLHNKANVNAPLTVPTIHRAKNWETIKVLVLEGNADLSIKDSEGNSAWHYIIKNFKKHNVLSLLPISKPDTLSIPIKVSIQTPLNRHSRSLSDSDNSLKNEPTEEECKKAPRYILK